MNILDVKTTVVHYVETNDPEFGGMYRRGGSKDSWEQLMGESWEPVYFRQEELEEQFQNFCLGEFDDE